MRPVDDRTDQGPEEFDQALDQARAGDLRALLRLVASGDAEADQRQLESLRELIAPPVPDIVLQRGTRLGSFTIREPIGAGGMGCVYLADQEAPRREVALKVLRRGSLSNRALGRFEREQEALGRLNHPGIARIYDAGTSKRENDTDLPYFAMERVQGVDLLRHAREQDLTLRQRVQLLVRVVDAVRCAHESLVIHRDLKPDNILVTEEGQPKVLDFGVARLVDEDHVPSAARTVTGSPIGTWAYMSPEQGRGDSEGTSPASDVFSLGVIAWELLSGRSLWPPAWTELPPALGSVDRRLDGDVSAIIEKALEVDPRRRYQNARDLADDLNRYLAGRAVVARDIGMMGRAARIARRRPVATTAAIAITTMAITVLVFWTRLGNAASRERQLVLEEYGRRRDSAQSFISFLTKARLSELGPGATAGEFLRLGLLPIVERFADTPELYAQLLEETARTTVDLEEFALLEELAERLVAVRSRLDGARSSSVAAAMQFSVTALGRQGRHEEAVTAARHSLQLLEADPHSPAEILDAARNNLAVAEDEIGNKQEARSIRRSLYERRIELLGPTHPNTILSKCEWAVALKQIGRYDEADRLLAESLDAYGNLGDEYRFERALALSRRAEIRGTLGAYDVAVDLYEEALREVHPIAEERAEFPLRIKNQILECRLHLGPPADLVDEALHQTAVSRERFGDHARMTLVSAKTAARVLEAAGRREEALSMLDELRRTTDGRGDVGAALREEILYGQGTMLLRAGRHAEASEALQLIVARRREVLGDDEPATFEARLLLASAHSKVAPPEAVEAELRVLVGETIRSLGPQHPYTSMAAITLGAFLVVRGRPEEAIDLLERACPDLKSIVGTSFETAWKVPRVLAQAYRLAGRLDDAISLLREWIVHREGLPLHDDGPLAILHIELMLTLERARRTEEARAVGLRALTLIAQGASVRMRPETFAVTHDLLAPAIPAAAETTASIQTLEATLESLRPEPTMRSGVDSASEPPR